MFLYFSFNIGGEILSQSFKEHTLSVKVLADGIHISLLTPRSSTDAHVPADLLDNRWHTLQFLMHGGSLNLMVDRESTIISNNTFNSMFITDQEVKKETAILIVGNKFSGCLLQGPNLIFMTESNGGAVFGSCPLALGPCSDHDILIRVPTVDYCQNEPCMRHGECISRADGYECQCYARYSGKNCQIDGGSACRTTPCKNNGVCEEDANGDFKCKCMTGYTGKTCEIALGQDQLCVDGRCEANHSYCASNPCENNGVCIDTPNGFVCDCSGSGYTGNMCQYNIDECTNSPCLNNGVCFDNYGYYTCECPTGYAGQNCEHTVNECLSFPCQHGSTCIEMNGGFECRCAPGYSGVFCENTSCNPKCPPDSDCIEGRCICKPGVTGSRCESPLALAFQENFEVKQEKSETCSAANCFEPMICLGNRCICPPNETCSSPCATLPCQNQGTCKPQGSDFVCVCPLGFEGALCENDIDECKPNLNTCEHGICINKPGYVHNSSILLLSCSAKEC